MNKETYEALKRLVAELEAETKGTNPRFDEHGLLSDIKQVETWIDEVAKEYEEDKKYPKCKGCGEYLLDGQMVVKGENRHSACA